VLEDSHYRIMVTEYWHFRVLSFVSKVSKNFKLSWLIVSARYIKMIDDFIRILDVMEVILKGMEGIPKITRISQMSSEEIFSY